MVASQKFQDLSKALTAANGYLGTGGTKVKVDTQNLSFVFGYQPTKTSISTQVLYYKQLKVM